MAKLESMLMNGSITGSLFLLMIPLMTLSMVLLMVGCQPAESTSEDPQSANSTPPDSVGV